VPRASVESRAAARAAHEEDAPLVRHPADQAADTEADDQLGQHDRQVEDAHVEPDAALVDALRHDREGQADDRGPADAEHGHQRVEHPGRVCDERFERVRDYIVAHYRLNSRTDTDYWRDNARNDQLSNPLRSVLNAWHGRADLAAELDRLQLDSHFGAMSWHCLLAGYGAFPPLAPGQPPRGTGDRYLELRLEDFLRRCASNFLSVEACLPWAEGLPS
jgi:hypothetical protein